MRRLLIILTLATTGWLPVAGQAADKELLGRALDYFQGAKYHECMNGKDLLDKDFFDFLKKNGIKPSAPQIKRIRQLLGTKDPEAHEVYANPYKPKDGDWAWDPDLADTESVPWLTDIQEYLDKNVMPYAPDYRVDDSKTVIGYEIPFTREFYKYIAPRNSSVIFERLKMLDGKEKELMDKILG